MGAHESYGIRERLATIALRSRDGEATNSPRRAVCVNRQSEHLCSIAGC